MTDSRTPLVSIITATYNRSNVLRYTVASVINSGFRDWELLVVGDACTDDTGEVVGSFADPRVRFINLEKNVGEQSGPSNEGFRHARGRYIAYLNHDDLWMADHLETLRRGIEDTGADLVFSLGVAVDPGGRNVLIGASPTGRYYPGFGVPASLWLLRRALAEEIGPWRFYRECYAWPSQDFLIRAWKAGKDLRMVPAVTAFIFQSGVRRRAYMDRESDENRRYFERMSGEPGFRESELSALVLEQALAARRVHPVQFMRKVLILVVERIGLRLGIAPLELALGLRYRRRGGLIDKHRKRAGLPRPQRPAVTGRRQAERP